MSKSCDVCIYRSFLFDDLSKEEFGILSLSRNEKRYKKGDLPITEDAAEKVISLPMSTEMDEEQLAYITSVVLEYANR